MVLLTMNSAIHTITFTPHTEGAYLLEGVLTMDSTIKTIILAPHTEGAYLAKTNPTECRARVDGGLLE
jgi:predicted cupin superfamily sugar epimerase